MKTNREILFTIVGALAVMSIFSASLAMAATTDPSGYIQNPLGGTTTIQQVLDIVLVSVQTIAGVLSVVFIILAGLKFVTAGGDTKKIETARNMLLYVVIGIAILFGAKAISAVVQNTIQQVGGGK